MPPNNAMKLVKARRYLQVWPRRRSTWRGHFLVVSFTDAGLRVRESFGVPDGVLVFAAEGHSWLGLDYRESSECPSVVFGMMM